MRGWSPACGAHDRRSAFEGWVKKQIRVESTEEFQRTGGNRYTARVLVPDEDDGWVWQDVRRTEWDIHFATQEAAIEAATRAVADGTAKRAIVLHWTISVASEYGWTTNDQPVWRWVRS